MTLLTLIRIVFLLCLGVSLLTPNRVCQIVAGVVSIVLAVMVALGQF